jgi:rhodanese-related sulfurtransferase
VDLDELDELLKEGAELIDVRERGRARRRLHRRQPQHPLPAAAGRERRRPHRPPGRHDLRERRPCRRRASILAARGIDARPVLDGGVAAWAAQGGQMVEFRRCGS